ncbi:UxaA family hydrolase [Alicyclobacillus tolerans]|uniref:UxaA family hydrolase n=1 Tax=Alicyclobacillus tolerans TaxID=90970 RepID=UPI001F31B679|nr:UxaA family hydrolase [Alicyclobacillus tolerans]MCF8565610.1 UxaA family hydrolase [Alicyclobacillus tolerans]
MEKFLGYMREDGRIGVRNVVGVISTMDNVNPLVRAICANVITTLPITTLFGRGQFGYDRKITERTLIGLGKNPNVGACLVVGLERTTTDLVAQGISLSGKPVETLVLQETDGTVDAMAIGIRLAQKLAIQLSSFRRQWFPISHLSIGLQCGGSDTTSGVAANPSVGWVVDYLIDRGGSAVIAETAEFMGAENVFADRAVNDRVRQEILQVVSAHEARVLQRGYDIRGTNPSPDNIRGGLTTIEEKSLGALSKSGSRPVQGVLEYAASWSSAGLWFMDTPSPAVESITALAAGGCQLILFTTGMGNPIGSTVAPTIKITGNPDAAARFADSTDVDVSDVITQSLSLEQVGQRLMSHVAEVASGTLTVSESLSFTETAISRFEFTV